MENLIIFLILLAVGYGVGSIAESRHYASIREREQKFLSLPTVMTKTFPGVPDPQEGWLVSGNVVVSIDYFKRILAFLRNIFGGRVGAYETLVDRGRREAILRMKESAKDADAILNLRIETSSISRNANRKNSVGSIEVFAYGTAIRFTKSS